MEAFMKNLKKLNSEWELWAKAEEVAKYAENAAAKGKTVKSLVRWIKSIDPTLALTLLSSLPWDTSQQLSKDLQWLPENVVYNQLMAMEDYKSNPDSYYKGKDHQWMEIAIPKSAVDEQLTPKPTSTSTFKTPSWDTTSTITPWEPMKRETNKFQDSEGNRYKLVKGKIQPLY